MNFNTQNEIIKYKKANLSSEEDSRRKRNRSITLSLYIRIMKKVVFAFTLAFVSILSFYGCGTGSNTSQ